MKVILFSEISIDGKLTVAQHTSKELIKLLSEKENNLIQDFRKEYDAILIGSKTVLMDNPNLTYRKNKNHSPIRLILSNRLDFSFKENIFLDNNRTVLVTDSQDEGKINYIRSLGKEVVRLEPSIANNTRKVISILEDTLGIKSMIVEGGGITNWMFLKHDLFDEIHLLQLPILIGGKVTTTLIDGKGFPNIDSCINYNLKHVEKLNKCLYLSYVRKE